MLEYSLPKTLFTDELKLKYEVKAIQNPPLPLSANNINDLWPEVGAIAISFEDRENVSFYLFKEKKDLLSGSHRVGTLSDIQCWQINKMDEFIKYLEEQKKEMRRTFRQSLPVASAISRTFSQKSSLTPEKPREMGGENTGGYTLPGLIHSISVKDAVAAAGKVLSNASQEKPEDIPIEENKPENIEVEKEQLDPTPLKVEKKEEEKDKDKKEEFVAIDMQMDKHSSPKSPPSVINPGSFSGSMSPPAASTPIAKETDRLISENKENKKEEKSSCCPCTIL